jgi:hypothetical protein
VLEGKRRFKSDIGRDNWGKKMGSGGKIVERGGYMAGAMFSSAPRKSTVQSF